VVWAVETVSRCRDAGPQSRLQRANRLVAHVLQRTKAQFSQDEEKDISMEGEDKSDRKLHFDGYHAQYRQQNL
jgi:hypothetical protein